MPRVPGEDKFTYYNHGSPDKPVNPAVSKILQLPHNRAFMTMLGLQGQVLFQAWAPKGKDPNPTRLTQMVRVNTDLVQPIDWFGAPYGKKDRWAAYVESFAPHAVSREFGWDQRDLYGKKHKGFYEKASDAVTKRHIAAHREKTGDHTLRAVAMELDRLYHRKMGG